MGKFRRFRYAIRPDSLTQKPGSAIGLYSPQYEGCANGSSRQARICHREPRTHPTGTQTCIHQLRDYHHQLRVQQDLFCLYAHADCDQDVDESFALGYHHHHECRHVALRYLLPGTVPPSSSTLGCQSSGNCEVLADLCL